MEGKTQEAAAAGAGHERAQRAPLAARVRIRHRHVKPHPWRTRPDPFAGVFDSEVAPLLAVDEKRSAGSGGRFWASLNRRHPGCFSAGQLRTLQRRIREWRALHGPEKEVYFPQDHPPGREAAFDFTNCNEFGGDYRRRAVRAPVVRIGAFSTAAGAGRWWRQRELRGAGGGSARGAVGAGRSERGVAFGQSVGRHPRSATLAAGGR